MPRTISPSAMRQRCRMAMKGAARWRNGAMGRRAGGATPRCPVLASSPCGSRLCRFMRCYGGLQGLDGAGQVPGSPMPLAGASRIVFADGFQNLPATGLRRRVVRAWFESVHATANGHMPAICRAVRACGSVVRHSALLPSFGRLAALCAGVFDQREVSMTTIRWVAAATVALACGAGAGSAGARDVHWSIGVVVPGVVPGAGVGDVGDPVYRPAPVYVAPPVYLAPPPPVYYVPPRPIYYSAPPVYYAPPVVVYGGHGPGIYHHGFHRFR